MPITDYSQLTFSCYKKAKSDIQLQEEVLSLISTTPPKGFWSHRGDVVINCIKADNDIILDSMMKNWNISLSKLFSSDLVSSRNSMALFYWSIYFNANRCMEMLINKGQVWFPDRNPSYPDHQLVNLNEGRLEVHDTSLLCMGKMKNLRKAMEKYPLDIEKNKAKSSEPFPVSELLKEYDICFDDIWHLVASELGDAYPVDDYSVVLELFLSELVMDMSNKGYKKHLKKQLARYSRDYKYNERCKKLVNGMLYHCEFISKVTYIVSQTADNVTQRALFARPISVIMGSVIRNLGFDLTLTKCINALREIKSNGYMDVGMIILRLFIPSQKEKNKLINAVRNEDDMAAVLDFLTETPLTVIENYKLTEKKKTIAISLLSK